MKKISKQEYIDTFIKGRKKEDIEASYKKAWEAKNFEIDNYWKRANYFWAFQVATFAGYFAVLNVDKVEISYIVICVGIVTSWAWYFINKGSKAWQRNWENHVDMLEDYITGPLYKRVSVDKTFSVSKINELVSQFIAWIWVFIAVHYWIVNGKIDFLIQLVEKLREISIPWIEIILTILVIVYLYRMIFGKGRGRFGARKVSFYKRETDIED